MGWWLANGTPPFAAYRALMACRLIPLDKQPGVRPVGIGEVYRRLLAKCVLIVCGHVATASCGNANLCVGLEAGIEGAAHAMALDSPPTPRAAPNSTISPSNPTEPTDTPDQAMDADWCDDTEPMALLLVDARNGFNELNRVAALWTARYRWTAGSGFAFNCYRHSAILILRRPGRPCLRLLSEEGVTQGDPLSMVLYGIALAPLTKRLRAEEPVAMQAWYADDCAIRGPASKVASVMQRLMELGPAWGYFPEPDKSVVICDPSREEALKAAFGELQFRYSDGERYIGTFVGSKEARAAWLAPKVKAWAEGVRRLAKVACRYPQTAYAGLAKSLQSEWQFLQRVTPDVGEAFAPVEEAIRESFLPALLGEEGAVSEDLRTLASWGTHRAGIGVPDPQKTADACLGASRSACDTLTKSLLERTELDLDGHKKCAYDARLEARRTRVDIELKEFGAMCERSTAADKRRLLRATETGGWLTAMPNALNGTELSTDEFRDSLRIRFGLTPLALPATCDGCGCKFLVEHGLSCKKGGLVTLRHNELAAEWRSLCATALTPAAVSTEPLIHSGRTATGEGTASEQSTPGTIKPEERGDVGVRGFWKRGSATIFDVRIVDTDAPTYRSRDPAKVLASHEKQKKGKYLGACLKRRRHFTPLVFLVNGLMGAGATAACKRLASLLSSKWGRTYSEVCGFVRSRLAISLVRATSLCLRDARDPTARTPLPYWESGTGLELYR